MVCIRFEVSRRIDSLTFSINIIMLFSSVRLFLTASINANYDNLIKASLPTIIRTTGMAKNPRYFKFELDPQTLVHMLGEDPLPEHESQKIEPVLQA